MLAASIGSGPHVTRHHFHHSYGNAGPGDVSALAPFLFPPGAHADLCDNADGSQQPKLSDEEDGHFHPPTPFSGQMARSERLKLIQQQQQRILAHRRAQPHRRDHSHDHSHGRRSSRQHTTDVNQTLDSIVQDVFTPSPATAKGHEPTPPVWEGSVYESQQMPRRERLRREAEVRKALQEKSHHQDTPSKPAKADEAVDEAFVVAQAKQAATKTAAEQPIEQSTPHTTITPKEQAVLKAAAARQAEQAAAMASIAGVTSTVEASAEEALSANPAALRGKPFIKTLPPIQVRCHARTRVPTPHGEVFVHIYRNNHDDKEHLALVVDTAQNDVQAMAQLEGDPSSVRPPGNLRSRTLEEVWSRDETALDRIVRGAYVGRLGPEFQRASAPGAAKTTSQATERMTPEEQAPLVRIHSECYTGETIGSQRCDCGEQLDEAIRLIGRTGRDYADGHARGVVVYLRQEGRGIGLLDKIMAYNLQDMGADTVAANILLGHLPDARQYDIASAILRDLGVDRCRLLTNNPEKMDALEDVGVQVTQRVAMVPRMWQPRLHRRHGRHHGRHRDSSHGISRTASPTSISASSTPGGRGTTRLPPGPSRLQESTVSIDGLLTPGSVAMSESASGGQEVEQYDDNEEAAESDDSEDSYLEYALRRGGLTMLGGSVTRGPELEKYLRTKVERMGHLLDLPPESEPEPQHEVSADLCAQQQHQPLDQRKEAPQPTRPLQVPEDPTTSRSTSSESASAPRPDAFALDEVVRHSRDALERLPPSGQPDASGLQARLTAVLQASGDPLKERTATTDLVDWASEALANQESAPLSPALTGHLGQMVLTGTRFVRPRI